MRFSIIASLAAVAGTATAIHSAKDIVQDLTEMSDLARSFTESLAGLDMSQPGSDTAFAIGTSSLLHNFAMKAANVTAPPSTNFTTVANHLIQVAAQELLAVCGNLTKGMVSAAGIPPTATSFLETIGLDNLEQEMPKQILGSFMGAIATMIGKYMSTISTGANSATQEAVASAFKNMVGTIANSLSNLTTTTSVEPPNVPPAPTFPAIATILSLPKLSLTLPTLPTAKIPAVPTAPGVTIPTLLPTLATLPKLPTLGAIHI